MGTIDPASIKVALLSGGWSDERDISLSSGDHCAEALAKAGFTQVDRLDPADKDFVERMVAGAYDVAFVAMHGIGGEDGCIQGMLELLHVPYTFSGVKTHAVAMDKELTKLVFRANGIPTPGGVLITAEAWRAGAVDQAAILAETGLPAFVKPADNGSSIGISRVNTAEELPTALAEAFAHGNEVLVETFIAGTEITVPVIGANNEAQVLPVVEVVPGDAEFYDLQVKYEAPELHHVIPARLPADVYARAQELGLAAHNALGCLDASRTDFIVTPEGEPIALEVNTIPGMTRTSLLPDCAAREGIEFPELCRRFIEWALARAEG